MFMYLCMSLWLDGVRALRACVSGILLFGYIICGVGVKMGWGEGKGRREGKRLMRRKCRYRLLIVRVNKFI